MIPIEDAEVRRIAGDLAAKYGRDAIAFVTARAERAAEIGDDIAYAIWDTILGAARELLRSRANIDGSAVAP